MDGLTALQSVAVQSCRSIQSRREAGHAGADVGHGIVKCQNRTVRISRRHRLDYVDQGRSGVLDLDGGAARRRQVVIGGVKSYREGTGTGELDCWSWSGCASSDKAAIPVKGQGIPVRIPRACAVEIYSRRRSCALGNIRATRVAAEPPYVNPA